MKGVVLAGGTGTRLYPLTRITNKHLLPVYDKPMIYYPIQTLVEAGIRDIMIVTGGYNAGDFLRLLGRGREFGLRHLQYGYQEQAGGIAEALGLAEDFVDGDKCVVILGDNILERSIAPYVERFAAQERGARILLKEMEDQRHLSHLGVPIIEHGRLLFIREKPATPPSPYAVIGVYMYDSSVFDVVRRQKPSGRGELEITDVNNAYIDRHEMEFDVIDGWWGDAGESIEAYLSAINFVAQRGTAQPEPAREAVAV
ncbi:MAG: NTP transferase domain-containing protein [Chloroflexi bacterium]|nr:NTP transferase domain-containing protein [Chloroflexota bacterium]